MSQGGEVVGDGEGVDEDAEDGAGGEAGEEGVAAAEEVGCCGFGRGCGWREA